MFCTDALESVKSLTASAVVDYLQHKFQEDKTTGAADSYCNLKSKFVYTAFNIMSSLLVQLIEKRGGTLPGWIEFMAITMVDGLALLSGK